MSFWCGFLVWTFWFEFLVEVSCLGLWLGLLFSSFRFGVSGLGFWFGVSGWFWIEYSALRVQLWIPVLCFLLGFLVWVPGLDFWFEFLVWMAGLGFWFGFLVCVSGFIFLVKCLV